MALPLLYLTLAGCSAGCSGGGAAHEAALTACHAEAQKFGAAMKAQDWERYVDLAHPDYVRKAGGRDRAAADLRAEVKRLRFRVDKLQVHRPDRLVVASEDVLAVVPVSLEVRAEGKRLAGMSYFLGVSSDQGATWSFLDGYSLNADTIKKALPNFPPGVKLPATQLRERDPLPGKAEPGKTKK